MRSMTWRAISAKRWRGAQYPPSNDVASISANPYRELQAEQHRRCHWPAPEAAAREPRGGPPGRTQQRNGQHIRRAPSQSRNEGWQMC